MRNRAATIAIFIFAIASIAAAQERFVKPVDEAAQDASFLAFRTKLIAAAERKDAAFILSVLDPKIDLSFGGDVGVPAFRRIWKINSKTSPFWREFLLVVKNGGKWRKGEKGEMTFYAPYTFDGFPEDLDAFGYYVIFGNNVNLRKEPNTNSESIATLSYNIVQIEQETVPKSGRSEYPGWWQIKTLGGQKGFVKKEFVRSPIDYRAGFEKKRGAWKLVAFIAGD